MKGRKEKMQNILAGDVFRVTSILKYALRRQLAAVAQSF
jgi:hypothetical protein